MGTDSGNKSGKLRWKKKWPRSNKWRNMRSHQRLHNSKKPHKPYNMEKTCITVKLKVLQPWSPPHRFFYSKYLEPKPHYLSMYQFSIPIYPVIGCSRQEAIPACTGWTTGYARDRLSMTIIPLCMYYVVCEPCTVPLTLMGLFFNSFHHQHLSPWSWFWARAM